MEAAAHCLAPARGQGSLDKWHIIIFASNISAGPTHNHCLHVTPALRHMDIHIQVTFVSLSTIAAKILNTDKFNNSILTSSYMLHHKNLCNMVNMKMKTLECLKMTEVCSTPSTKHISPRGKQQQLVGVGGPGDIWCYL